MYYSSSHLTIIINGLDRSDYTLFTVVRKDTHSTAGMSEHHNIGKLTEPYEWNADQDPIPRTCPGYGLRGLHATSSDSIRRKPPGFSGSETRSGDTRQN